MVLRYGIELNEWMLDWCERARASSPTRRRAGGGEPDVRPPRRLAQRRRKRVVIVAAVVLRRRRRARRRRRRPPRPLRRRRSRRPRASQADDRLEDAGYRDTGVVVLVEGVDVDHGATGASGSTRSRDELARRPRRRDRSPAIARHRLARLRLRDGDATYLAVGLTPTDDDERQDAGERIADSLEDEPGVTVGGTRASPSSRSTSRSRGPAHAPSCSPSRSSSCSRCSSSAASSRRCCRCWSAGWRSSARFLMLQRRQRARLGLDLRAQPGHRPRARAGDRLQPVHRLALPRGDRPHRARASRRCAGRWRPPAARCCSAR